MFGAMFGIWVYFTASLKMEKSSSEIALRGVWKLHNIGQIEFEKPHVMKTWGIVTAAFSVSAWIAVSALLWNHDLNFLIGLFPFLWYYFILRYFIWEKDDIIDQPAEKK